VVFFHGDGGNGKTVFTYVLGAVLGSYRAVSQESAFTISKQGHRGHAQDIAVLKGARLVVCAEPDEGRMWDMGRVKQWSGNEGKIRANLMRQNSIEFEPQGKLILVANHLLDIQTVDSAVQRRLRVVPWNNTPKLVDKTLKETLVEEEAGAILAWALEGQLEYLKQGLPPCSVIDEASAEYLNEKDVMGRFVADCFEITAGKTAPIPLAKVGELFNEWAIANGEKQIRRMKSQALRSKGIDVSATHGRQMVRNAVITAAACNLFTSLLQRRHEAKTADGELPKIPRPDWWPSSGWPFSDQEKTS
jgi:putative DNA primase/helicase